MTQENLPADNFTEVLSPPTEAKRWDYEKSVKRVHTHVNRWKKVTEDIARELYAACKVLSREGGSGANQYKSGTGANAPDAKTWADYCEEIGSTKSTVNRWLKRWFGKHPSEWDTIDGFNHARKLIEQDGMDRKKAGQELEKYAAEKGLIHFSKSKQEKIFSAVQQAPEDIKDKISTGEMPFNKGYDQHAKKRVPVSTQKRKKHKKQQAEKGYSQYQLTGLRKRCRDLDRITDMMDAFMDDEDVNACWVLPNNSNGNGRKAYFDTAKKIVSAEEYELVVAIKTKLDRFGTTRAAFNKFTQDLHKPFLNYACKLPADHAREED